MSAAHVAVLALGATGHLLPALDVIAELRLRGHRVTCLVPDTAAPAALGAGADVVTYETTLVPRPATPVPPEEFAMWLPFVLVAEAAVVLPQALAALRDDVPDVVLYDRAAYPTGRALAQLLRRLRGRCRTGSRCTNTSTSSRRWPGRTCSSRTPAWAA